MDAFRGVHAIGTTLFILFLVYVTYGFYNDFFSTVTYDLFRYILWTSFITIILITAAVVPATIAFGEEPETSFISAFAAFGLYSAGTIIMRVSTPIAQYFVGEEYSGVFNDAATNGMLTAADATTATQWVSLLWIVGVIMILFLIPIAAALMPSLFEKGYTLVKGDKT